jgi:hypothetical protein
MRWRPLAALAAICSVSMASCASHTPDAEKSSEKVGEASQELVSNCKYLDQSVYPPLPVEVDFDRELVIRALSVVEDPCRTTWTPTVACPAGTVGAWTFGHLMTEMAGSTPPAQFVAEWVHTFEVDQVVNGFPVPHRANVRAVLIDPWLVASGCAAGSEIVGPKACKLDLKRAPFRLLAITNRADLSGPSYGSENPGEARFVFGVLQLPGGKPGGGGKGDPGGKPGASASIDLAAAEAASLEDGAIVGDGKGDGAALDPYGTPPDGDGSGGQLVGEAIQATTILEYRIPPGLKLVDWTARWHELSGIPLDKPEFNQHLQEITDSFVSSGVNPERPNKGSSIGQVRTNERPFGDDGIWELREFTLQDVGRGIDGFALQNDTTKQTPDDSQNSTTPLDTWTIANESLIMDVDHVVPNDFLGGVSRETFFVWEPGTGIDPLASHHFQLTTCNGCHTNATNTGFTHVSPRPLGSVAALSAFLGTNPIPDPANNGDPLVIQNVTDELGNARVYNEGFRRICEEHRILRGDPDPYTRGNGGIH